ALRGADAASRRVSASAARPVARSSRQIRGGQPASGAGRVALEGKIDGPGADVLERVALLRGHRREEADRGEARDRVDLREVDRVALEEEVDSGEAFGTDRPVRISGDLEDHRALLV